MRPLKKTTITPNRFTTYTQSWWAKSAYLLSILFILFSCEENLNFLGFKSDQQRFKVYYAEIPVESSVLLMDSLSTLSFSSTSAATSRLLFGKYVDPVFGSIEAKAIAQFRPISFPFFAPTAEYDSIMLNLRYDFYSYGTLGETSQTVSVYEVTQVLDFTGGYFSNTPVSISNTPLATTDLPVDDTYFKAELANKTHDSILTAKFRLDDDFGHRLFDAANPEDTLYTNVNFFIKKFKGLAIVPQQADKIVGISSSDPNTSLVLYYHEGDTKKAIVFSLANLIAFSQINADRSVTELSGLNSFYSDYTATNNRHIQNGTSIITKLDFSKFYEYMDTIPQIIINSVELSINNAEPSTEFAAPDNLSLAMLRTNNRYKTFSSKQDTLDYVSLGGAVTTPDFSKMFASDDGGSLLTLPYSSDNNTYKAYPTLFFQRLFNLKQNQYPYWAFLPSTPPAGKAVNRTVFQKDNIKLKIYYTRSTLTENP